MVDPGAQVSDADREYVLSRLREAYERGLLSFIDYDSRVLWLPYAKVHGDLDQLLTGIPSRGGSRQHWPDRWERAAARRWRPESSWWLFGIVVAVISGSVLLCLFWVWSAALDPAIDFLGGVN